MHHHCITTVRTQRLGVGGFIDDSVQHVDARVNINGQLHVCVQHHQTYEHAIRHTKNIWDGRADRMAEPIAWPSHTGLYQREFLPTR